MVVGLFAFGSLFVRSKRGCVVGRRFVETLVSTDWLADNVASVKVVQASWSGCQDYRHGHIPSAVCFDGSVCKDRESPYKNILPSAEVFQKYVSESLGVSNDSHVIVYDDSEVLPSLNHGARVWFMFRVFGHNKVSLLNGGLCKWNQESRPLETVTPSVQKTNFSAQLRPELLTAFERVLENVKNPTGFQLVDSRVPGRYHGIGLDPYGKAGHIPKAVNIPVARLIDPDTKMVLEKSELADVFRKSRIDLQKPVTFHCGSGVHACAGIMAAFLLGKTDATLYNGSWCEWNQRVGDDMIIK